MKRPLILIIATFHFLGAFSQSPVDFGKLLSKKDDTAILSTTDFLNMINWQGIKDYSKDAHRYFVYEDKDSLISTYGYTSVLQGGALFEIVSYKGTIIEYYYVDGNSEKYTPNSFFSKTVWLKYVDEIMPSLPEQFKLANNEPNNILKAYYQLLGANTLDRYGFNCENSTEGRPTSRRIAVIALLKNNRIDLLKKLFDYPNLQTKLYAIDALIYNDYTAKLKIQQLEKKVKERQKLSDRLQKKNADKTKIDDLKNQINILSDSISNSHSDLLTEAEWKMIYTLRDSNLKVKLCGISGPGTPISKCLSDYAITDEIPSWYRYFNDRGYFGVHSEEIWN